MTKYVSLEEKNIDLIVDTFKKGGIVIFPTETVYGIGCNALSNELIDKVYEVKKRPRDKAINIMVGNKKDISKYAYINSHLESELIDKYMPGPITIIFERKDGFGEHFCLGNEVGIRIPDNDIMIKVLERLDFPIIATSANLSGMASSISVEDLKKDFDNNVDLIVDGGRSKIGIASTIVKVKDGKKEIIRQGSLHIDV